MRSLLLVLFVAVTALAQGVTIKTVEWNVDQAGDGQRIRGRIVLSAPSPTDTKVIFEPTFHLEMPTIVPIAAGQTMVEFPVKVVDNRFISGGTPDVPTVTALFNGQLWEGPGPVVRN